MGSTYMAGSLGDHCPQDRPVDIARISRCRDIKTYGNGRTNKFLVIGFIHRIENCQWFSGGIFYRGDPCLDQFLLSFYKGTGSSFDSGYKGGSGRVFYHIDPYMGAIPQFIFYYFFSYCFTGDLYECFIRNRKYK